MKFHRTKLNGPILIEPKVHGDARGFFIETFRTEKLSEIGINHEFVQDNHSRSRKGTLRGMHFQRVPGQAKLVRCARGAVLDVIVDVRRGSPTFGNWESFQLDDENHHTLYIPIGFAHGFCVLTDEADFVYKCSSYYDTDTELELAYNDPDVGIQWPDLDLIVSERDIYAPRLHEIAEKLPFIYEGDKSLSV